MKKTPKNVPAKVVEPAFISGPKPSHISASQLDQFETCEVRWHYIYIAGVKLAPGFALMQGSSFHFAENENFRYKIKKGKDLKISVVRDAFAQDFKERQRQRKVLIANAGIQVSEKEDAINPKEAERVALKSLGVFHETVAPHVIPEGSEVAGEITINGLEKPYTLKYAIDLIGRPIEIIKGKFRAAKKGWSLMDWKLIGKSMNPFEIERSFQYPAYTGAFLSLKGQLPDQFALLATVKTKEPKIQMLSVKPRADKIKWFMDRVARALPAMEDIRSGRRLPRPALLHPNFLSPCKPSSCGLWGICKVRPR